MSAGGETAGRKRVWATPANVKLLPLSALEDPGARNLVLQIGDAFFHGFLVRKGEAVHGYVDRCPHAGLPLARELDHYLTPDKRLIACAWHGALFQVEDGLCVGGPCSGGRLTPWPVTVRDGMVVTA
ncbi:Rieske (2Fe-2S) protein [Myxococcus sp. Y35]|uniref:Rieske (2Fe-2S) protein n=1 Tax=Pseudomyxococcus flavus TaxID=3115648 RepID=UPI003CE728B6